MISLSYLILSEKVDKPANQVNPGSNPTRGDQLKSDPWLEDKIKKKLIKYRKNT